jgi:hypothetical protein
MPYIKNAQSDIEIEEIKTSDSFNLEEELIKLARQGFISKGD